MLDSQTRDVLANVLATGQLGSRVVCRPKLPAPWGLEFPSENKAHFHIVKRGVCFFFKNKSHRGIQLGQGDVLFAPRAMNYHLASSNEANTGYYADEIARIHKSRKENIDTGTHLLCGSYELKSGMSLPFFSLMPEYITVKANKVSNSPHLNHIIQIILQEDSLGPLGSDLVIARMIDVLLIYIVRHWINKCDATSVGWLGALRDAEVSKALSLIHEAPHQKWTVERLAKEVGVSRTKFINRFRELVGITPMKYVANWRFEVSVDLLKNTGMSILEVANSVGYDSETAFIRTFKKVKQTTPGKFRSSL